jgi:hypothetical protein
MWLVPFAILLLVGVLTMDSRLHINGDNVAYMRLAESIRGGDIWPASRFPPGFPWLLAGVQSLWGLALLPQKMLVLLFYALGSLLAVRLAQSTWGPLKGALAACLGMSLVPVLEYGHLVLSEVPFLAVTLAALWFVDGNGKTHRPHGPMERAVVAGVLAGISFWIRSMGLAIVVAIPLAYLLRGGRRLGLASFLAALLVILPWIVKTAVGGGAGESYIRQLLLVNPYHPEFGYLTPADFLTRVVSNAKEYFILEIPHAVFPVQFRSTYTDAAGLAGQLPTPAVAGALFLTAIGLVREGWRRRAWVLVVVLTLGICIVWPPVWASSRFLLPVIPFLMWGLLSGTEQFGKWVLGRRGPWLLWTVTGVLVVLALTNAWRLGEENRSYPQPWDNYFKAARWVRDSTAEDVLVIDRKPGLFGFASQRRCEGFPREPDAAELLSGFAERGVDLVVLSRIPYDDINRYLLPAVSGHPGSFKVIYREQDPPSGETYVFRFLGMGDGGPPGGQP